MRNMPDAYNKMDRKGVHKEKGRIYLFVVAQT